MAVDEVHALRARLSESSAVRRPPWTQERSRVDPLLSPVVGGSAHPSSDVPRRRIAEALGGQS
eukprot:1865122-Heterocapsa_arctica.AAC.1